VDMNVEVSYEDSCPIVKGDDKVEVLSMNILENAVIHNTKVQRLYGFQSPLLLMDARFTLLTMVLVWLMRKKNHYSTLRGDLLA
jgi:hypothetical protein